MKRYCLDIFIVSLILLVGSISFGQSINVETERFFGIKSLTVLSYNGCCAPKGYKAVFQFDSSGLVAKSTNYFKRKRLACYEYRYNEKGLLVEKKLVFDTNEKSHKDTTRFVYSFDEKNRITEKIEYFGKSISTTIFSDFDFQNNATTVTSKFGSHVIVEKRQFNASGQKIFSQVFRDDEITHIEECRYNEHGDKIYSNIPTLLNKETGKMHVLLGGNRYSVVEKYDYLYDKQNRWTEKYVFYDNRKVLLEKRIFK